MPDADDFDVEELRALLKGERPGPREAQTPGASAPGVPKKAGGGAPRTKSASPKPGGAKRAAVKASAGRTKGKTR